MLDPKKSLAIDAPPLAPYDDGFSTESEDLDVPEESQDLRPHDAVSAVSTHAVVIEDEEKAPAIPPPRVEKTIKREKEKNLPRDPVPVVRSEEETAERTAGAFEPPRNSGHKAGEEHCRNCRGYLTPLAERLQVMRLAAAQCSRRIPPPSRQCGCCYITYPLVALTDESRWQSWPEPRCYMCYWAARATKKTAGERVPRFKREKNGYGNGVGNGGEEESCCRNCKGKMTPLEQRLRVMKEAVSLKKGKKPPETLQCSWCWITYLTADFLTKNRDLTSTTPVCKKCESTAASTETNAPTSDAVATHNLAEGKMSTPEKAVHIIDEEDGDEDGELLEGNKCKCCYGNLMRLTKRVEMMKDAARKDDPSGANLLELL
ncbi:unnamed protein product [Phytophthora fragariaefolia]|uniref:Unnamed protein product n=1 Tax=Phytophthora fragariaefolia TaxID=1490495 RepID=A0A9W6YB33_9STRA|nr:unnamed protein product [Phytophthora fragariaefolia]